MWELAGRPCSWQPRTETMFAIFWSSPANFKTGIAFIYSVADTTSNSTQDVVWKVVGKAYWRILCGQVGIKFMSCHSAKSVYSFTVILAVKSILLGSHYGVCGDIVAMPDVMLRVWVQCRFFLPQSFSILLTEYYGL
jgi:hypothetical protein